MPQGGCYCNKIRIQFTGEPNANVLCHCLDCRKISGSSHSNNIIVSEDKFKLESGTPKTISRKADSGKEITSHFCGDCGTTVIRTGESFPGAVIIKAGVLDDQKWTSEHVPKAELYAPRRVSWAAALEGAPQIDAMPPS